MSTVDAKSKPPVYVTDGDEVIYRASALGMCTKALASVRMGYEPEPAPEWLQERFKQGIDYEAMLLKELTSRSYGIAMTLETDISLELPVDHDVPQELVILGHADLAYFTWDNGLDVDPTYIELRDVKAVVESTENMLSRDIFPIYKWQLSIYYWALKRKYPNTRISTAFIIIPKKTEDVMVNLSMRYEHDWREDEPYYSLEDIQNRVIDIEDMAEPGIPPEECEYTFFPCPVYYLHENADKGVIHNTPEIDEMVAEWYRLKDLEESAITQRKDLGDKIQDLMEEHSWEDVTTTAGPLKIVRRTNRRLDRKAIKQAGIDLSPYEKESFTSYIRR